MQRRAPAFTGVMMQKGESAKPAKSHGGIWSNYPNLSPNDGRQIDINCSSLVELLVRDPRGRKLGSEGKKQPTEIPGGIYDAFEGAVGNIFIPNPVWGAYHVSAVGSGYFPADCVFFSYNGLTPASVVRLRHLFVIAGEPYSFLLEYQPGSALKLTGGFDPGPADARKLPSLLTFATPTTLSYSLPSQPRITTAPFLIFYGEEIDASSFRAILNGSVVSGLFHPKAGSYEQVRIPLARRRNTLQLSLRGTGPHSREVKDTFEITVPEGPQTNG